MLLACSSITWAGCLGPRGLSATRHRYSEVIRRTNDEELLLSLVRLRYQDGTVFLPVSNITAQFEASGGVDYVNGTDAGDPSSLFTGLLRVSDRPTVVYNPSNEEQFKNVSSPLTLDQLEVLATSYNLGKVFRLFTNYVSGLDNASTGDGPPPPSPPNYEEFNYFADLLTQLQRQQAVLILREKRRKDVDYLVSMTAVDDIVKLKQEGFDIRKTDSGDGYVVNDVAISEVLQLRVEPDSVDTVNALRDVLGLDVGAEKYDMVSVPNQFPKFNVETRNSDIKITMRSLVQTSFFMSQAVEVPRPHIDAGHVVTTRNPDGSEFDWNLVLDDLFCVRCCQRRPKDAHVAVKHRGYWFYIPNCDVTSIGSLRLLNNAFSLKSIRTGTNNDAPVLTLSAGG